MPIVTAKNVVSSGSTVSISFKFLHRPKALKHQERRFAWGCAWK